MAQSLDDAPGNSTSVDKAAPLTWRKSTWSIASGQCIEATTLPGGRLVAVRDSVDMDGPVATFTERKWRTFVKRIKDGDLDAL